MALGDIAVERKVRRTLGREIQNAHAADAVEREVPDIVVAVKLADEIKALLLLHEPQRRDRSRGFGALRVGVAHLKLGVAVERVAYRHEDALGDFRRQHRDGARDEGNLVHPLARAARRFVQGLSRRFKDACERAADSLRQLPAQVLFEKPHEQALVGLHLVHRQISVRKLLTIPVGLGLAVGFDAQILAVAHRLEHALHAALADVVARLKHILAKRLRRHPALARNALQNRKKQHGFGHACGCASHKIFSLVQKTGAPCLRNRTRAALRLLEPPAFKAFRFCAPTQSIVFLLRLLIFFSACRMASIVVLLRLTA